MLMVIQTFVLVSIMMILFYIANTFPVLTATIFALVGGIYLTWRVVGQNPPPSDETTQSKIEKAKNKYATGEITLAKMEELVENPICEQLDQEGFEHEIKLNN